MSAPTPHLRDEYLGALLARDSTRARFVVDRAVEDGVDAQDVLPDVLGPALEEVGSRWERGELGIADEHFATTVTQSVVGGLGRRLRVPPRGGRLAVVACTPGETHVVGTQMLGDLLESAAWEVLPLGASLPADELAGLVEDERPDVVALSTTMPELAHGALDAIRAVTALHPRPYVVVGGRAWRDAAAARAASDAGADELVHDARTLVSGLVERFPPLPDDALVG